MKKEIIEVLILYLVKVVAGVCYYWFEAWRDSGQRQKKRSSGRGGNNASEL